MIGQLTPLEIEDLLQKQIVGRLACHNGDLLYIVPISYAYDGDYIYCHSYEGKKMELMRKNPNVCFQVDEFTDMANWKSVIAYGKFEELTGNLKFDALRLLLKRNLPINSSVTTHLVETWPFANSNEDELKTIPGTVFRILVSEKTGRFEKPVESSTMKFSTYT